MTREDIIQKIVKTLKRLPAEKIVMVADYADYILKKHEEYPLQSGIEKLVEQSKAFKFLTIEEDLYSLEDIKEKC